jgi:hypothetical protein
MKLCKDCRHLLPKHTEDWDNAEDRRKCGHSSAELPGDVSPVTGKRSPNYRVTATLNRTWGANSSGHLFCGPDARFFEPLPGFR